MEVSNKVQDADTEHWRRREGCMDEGWEWRREAEEERSGRGTVAEDILEEDWRTGQK